MENLLYKAQQALLDKSFKDGLDAYTQSNCRVSLTEDGLRIYRPPNLTVANDGNTMWGGLRLSPYNQNNRDVLIKGHTYIIKFHVKGKSSNAVTSIGWTNNMGWGGGGLNPSPSNVKYVYPPASFNGEMDCFYQFTINDAVYKVCTSSYSSFVAGNTYLSYRHFMVGFGYQSTLEMGTDMYITNLRMYDITNGLQTTHFNKNGIVDSNMIIENKSGQLHRDGEIMSNQFYEF